MQSNLPPAESSHDEGSPTARGPWVGANSATILLIEDEDLVRTIMRLALRKAGYRVIEAVNGDEALVRWRDHGGAIDLILTDVDLGNGDNGEAVASQLRGEKPDVKILLITGGIDQDWAPGENSRRHVLRKPFDLAKLNDAVARIVRE